MTYNETIESIDNMQAELVELLGAELVLDEVMRALSVDNRKEILEFIAKNWTDMEINE